jgi:hypothetical protein
MLICNIILQLFCVHSITGTLEAAMDGPAAGDEGDNIADSGGGGRRLGGLTNGRKVSTTIDNLPTGFPYIRQQSSRISCCKLRSCWRRINRPTKFFGEFFGTFVCFLYSLLFS